MSIIRLSGGAAESKGYTSGDSNALCFRPYANDSVHVYFTRIDVYEVCFMPCVYRSEDIEPNITV